MEVQTEKANKLLDQAEGTFVMHVYRTRADLRDEWGRRTTAFYGPMHEVTADTLVTTLIQSNL